MTNFFGRFGRERRNEPCCMSFERRLRVTEELEVSSAEHDARLEMRKDFVPNENDRVVLNQS